MPKNLAKIQEAIEPVISDHGCELVDLEYVKEKSQDYLRLYVDKQPGGIDIETIADLSELVGEKLDSLVPDPLPDPYILELSSPGLERPIKKDADWEKAKDQYIHVGLYQKLEGEKVFEGFYGTLTRKTFSLKSRSRRDASSLLFPVSK